MKSRFSHFLSFLGISLTLLLGCPGIARGQEEHPSEDPIIGTLSLPDFNLEAVVQNLQMLEGRPILRTTNLPEIQVTFDLGDEELRRSEAIMALQSLLALNGIAAVAVGDPNDPDATIFIKLVPLPEVQRHSPNLIEGSARAMPPSLAYWAKVYELDYLDPQQEAVPLIQALASNPQNIVVYPKTNAIMVTDTLHNLQRIERILEQNDTPGQDNIQVLFFPLKNVSAPELARQLQTLLLNQNSPVALPFLHNTTIEADERSNQLLVLTHPSNEDRLRKIIDQLDIDVEPQTGHESYYLKHAEESTQVETILNALIEGQQQAAEQAAGRNANNAANNTNAPNNQPPAANVPANVENIAQQLGSEGTLTFSDFVNVVADERANAIHATGTPNDLRIIGELIDKIDVLLPQVRIEILIAEVQLSDGQQSGIGAFGLSYDNDGDGGNTVQIGGTANGAPPGLSVGSGLNIGNLATTFSSGGISNIAMDMLLQQARSSSDVEILSSPTIMTQHNKEATINVSEQRPLVSGTSTNDGVTTSDVDYRDVGIQLTVKPFIGNNGLIQMEIEQTIDQFGNETFTIDNNENQPNILKREASSFVSVQDGQTIVLGGLRQREVRSDQGRLFLLGDLPILGPIFQPESETVNYTDLIIFIRPTVVHSPMEAAPIAERELNNMEETGETIREYYDSGKFPEEELPPYDPLNLREVLGREDNVEIPAPERPVRRGPRR